MTCNTFQWKSYHFLVLHVGGSFSLICSLHCNIVSIVNDKTCLRTLSLKRKCIEALWKSIFILNSPWTYFCKEKIIIFINIFLFCTAKCLKPYFFIICLIVTIVSKVGSQYIHELWIKLMKNACSCKEIKKWLKLNIFLDVAVFIWPEVLCTSSTITNFVFLISIVLIFIIFKTENFKNA